MTTITKRFTTYRDGEGKDTESSEMERGGAGLTMNEMVTYANGLIEDLRCIGKHAMARRYRLTLASLMRFMRETDVRPEVITTTFIDGYEESMRKRGLCRNTTSFYMRNLRSIINRASDAGYDVPHNLFRHVYMGIDRTVKRSVTLKTMCSIRDLDLSGYPHLDFTRNIFMFAFYMRGMSFVDMAFLKKSDLRHGIITYSRRKTSQQIRVKVEAQTREVMERLGESGTRYLLPLIVKDGRDGYEEYRSVYHRINRNLKKVGEMLGLDTKLTLYVARHTWASIAYRNNVPVSIISKAMGHDSETTTHIYLSSIDTAAVDSANSRIIALMQGKSGK